MKVKEKEQTKMVVEEGVVVATGGGGEEDRTAVAVVAMKMDSQSKELLTWALVKVAQPGDRVVALHVLPNSSGDPNSSPLHRIFFADRSCPKGKASSSVVSLIKEFDSMLAVYEGFCNLKQIDLQLKVCRGSSFRKTLVRETSNLAASKLILGVATNSHGIGSSPTSIAKYCAKKLPRDCWVLAVNNGKVVFERAPPLSSPARHPPSLLHESNGNSFCFQPTPKDWHHHSPNSKHRKSPLFDTSRNYCRSTRPPDLSRPEQSMALVPYESTPKPISVLIRQLPEAKPGWPLLRKAVLHNKKVAADKSKMSVVQWALRLPNRHKSSAAAVHPDQKPAKVDRTRSSKCHLDGESGAIVLAGIGPPRPSIAEEKPKLPKELESLQEKYSSMCRLFSYQELASATSNLAPENLIGKGGSSRVYKGHLPDGRELAVKILKKSKEAVKEFALEIDIITALHHKNIISLFGFCFENDELMLVYDFFYRGSLEENLHGEKVKKNSQLCWAERYKVAVGVAEALNYLHSGGGGQAVIHRDVKSSNILLSDDFEPLLSDFGLATCSSSASLNMTCNDVAGTFGYLAPEYFVYGKVNEKIDVYAFGVVLLELISGRKPIGNDYPKGQESLVMWAKPVLQSEEPKQLLDPSLGSKYDDDQVERMILAASLCIRRTSQMRPEISAVLNLLKGDEDVTKWARLQVRALEDPEELDDEASCPATDFRSHLNLALLDVEEDALSNSSTEHSVSNIMAHGSLEAYLQGRWSRSSSFD